MPEKYAAHVLRKEKNPPKELQINDKKAWQWEFPRKGGKLDQLTRRLVILLDADKIIAVEQKGDGAGLERVAKLFDFAKVETALANPPK